LRPIQVIMVECRVDFRFLRWIWRYGKDSRPTFDAALARHRHHLDIVELRSRRAARAYFERYAQVRLPR
jgi:hypothetical protein